MVARHHIQEMPSTGDRYAVAIRISTLQLSTGDRYAVAMGLSTLELSTGDHYAAAMRRN